MNNTYVMAVKYVDQFKWSVIPLNSDSKVPLIPWQEYQSRIATQEELKTWFEGTQNNIGIVTGKLSNLSVLDVDDLNKLAESLLKEVRSSINAMTIRGRHLYFTYSGETNSASKIADHIDVRGEGGFVVAPPSRVDGHCYRFISSHISPNLLRPFPRELLGDSDKDTDGGNAAKSTNPPGWIGETVDGILAGGPRTPNFVKIIGAYRRNGFECGDIYSLLKPLAIQREYDLNKLQELVNDQEERYPRPSKSTVLHSSNDQAEDIETFLEGDEKVEWIVPGLIAKNSLGFVAGLPESFKTWIMADLAVQAAKEKGVWLGKDVKHCKTLFIDQERFKGETKRRFKKLLRDSTANEVNGFLKIMAGSTIRLNLDESFEAFRRKLDEIRPELIIVDSFATFSTVAENDRQQVQVVLERLKALRQEYGCTIIMIDHENKSVLNPETQGGMPTAFTMIGSVAKPAAAEMILTIRKDKANTITVYNTKNTLATAMPPISLRVEDTDNNGVRMVIV